MTMTDPATRAHEQALAAAGARFFITSSEREGELILALRGELDLASSGELAEAAAGIVPGTSVTLDLRELSFMDSSGIRTLMNLDLRSRAEGWTLALASPQPAVRRVMTICAFEDRIPIVDAEPPGYIRNTP
jgi:anti-sigma B factor antagonist